MSSSRMLASSSPPMSDFFCRVCCSGATSANCVNNFLLSGWSSVAAGEIWIAGGGTDISASSPPIAAYSFNKKLLMLIIIAMVGSS